MVQVKITFPINVSGTLTSDGTLSLESFELKIEKIGNDLIPLYIKNAADYGKTHYNTFLETGDKKNYGTWLQCNYDGSYVYRQLGTLLKRYGYHNPLIELANGILDATRKYVFDNDRYGGAPGYYNYNMGLLEDPKAALCFALRSAYSIP